MTILGYARTSTAEQSAGLAAQERDLRQAGAHGVVSEQVSSMAGDRPGLVRVLALLTAGDVLMVTKPDRLARSTSHLLAIVDDLTSRGVGLVLLSMGGERFDTRNPTAKLMLTVLAAVAEFERNLMLERQREGIAIAKAAGRFKGRKRSVDRERARRLAGDIGAAAAAREMNVDRRTIHRILKEDRTA